MERKDWNWKYFGQLFSAQNQLFGIVRDTFAPMQIGAEIIPWILEDGKQIFVENLQKLGRELLFTHGVKVVDTNTILVRLDTVFIMPFENAEVVEIDNAERVVENWAKVEKRANELYVNGCKVVLCLSSRQEGENFLWGHDLYEELKGLNTLHPNILDVLIRHPHFFPEEMRRKVERYPFYIFFWKKVFSDNLGGLYVRFAYEDTNGKWCMDYCEFGLRFFHNFRAAMLKNG